VARRARAGVWNLVKDRLAAYSGPGALELKLGAVRVYRHGQRARGGRIEPTTPGTMLLTLEPRAVSLLAPRLQAGTVVVSATNGKTTTATMVAQIFAAAGLVPVHNRTGVNLASGVATELSAAARVGGRMKGDIGVFEVDEFWLQRLVPELQPSALVLGNLFRDQLDRYGELDLVAKRWEALVDGLQPSCRLIACADDPRVAGLAARRPGVSYFGIDDPEFARTAMQHASDPVRCPRCGDRYGYDAVYLAHLGQYRCATCGLGRPALDLAARSLALDGMSGSAFTLWRGAESVEVRLGLPGIFNVYNALAAAGIASAMGIGLRAVATALGTVAPAFGRAETIVAEGTPIQILLVKNPSGANAVLETLLRSDNGTVNLMVCLNDTSIDGHDVSWIWDADFEQLADRVRHVVCSGRRATELALRLKYAGIAESCIEIEPVIRAALDRALAASHDHTAGHTVYALPNYTAMLELREVLTDRGLVDRYWS
jgi:UDP-N-acetylmuramyl tripeptide synthase